VLHVVSTLHPDVQWTINILFQPTSSVPLTAGLNVHDSDDGCELNKKVELLPIESLVPSRCTGQEGCNQEGKTLVQIFEPGITLFDERAIGMRACCNNPVKSYRRIIENGGDAHEPCSKWSKDGEEGEQHGIVWSRACWRCG
jgi:hypothetical protein